jgi:hypothetical protein
MPIVGLTSKPIHMRYVEDALKATSSMDHLIKDLLNYSRTGRVELRPQMVVPTVTEERI